MLAQHYIKSNMFSISLFFLLFAALLFPSVTFASNVLKNLVKLSDVEISEKQNSLDLVLDFKGRPSVKQVNSGNPNLVVYDFSPAVFPGIRRESIISLPFILNTVIAQNNNRTVRVAVLTDGSKPQVSTGLSRGKEAGITVYTLSFKANPASKHSNAGSFIDTLTDSLNQLKESNKKLFGSSKDKFIRADRIKLPRTHKDSQYKGRTWTVVIDPGHGGKDPGALGKKLNEKDVVLATAFDIVGELNKIPFIKVVMTRTSDKFIRLRDRSAVAEKSKADLFVSLHCNSSTKKKSKGFEVYTLSKNGASDKVALEVAYKENSVLKLENNGADIDSTPMLNQILCSMMMTDTMNQSALLAGFIGKEAKKMAKMVYRGHKNANFYVLRTLKIPAVLVEMGFISNDKEGKLMNTKKWRKTIASRIAGGIQNYLGHLMMREGEFEDVVTTEYYVKRGDTLGGIAREYKTSVSNIVRLNSIGNGNDIQIGQTIKVPGDPVAQLLWEN